MQSNNHNNSRSDACYVCGETKSTGWHFGAITCEACKKFFIRNLECEAPQLKCARANHSCVVTKATRANCPACRYRKCQQVGMSASEKSAGAHAISFKEIACSVCGDASSGLHFGAITCEGCKGFFRRSAVEGQRFECKLGANCCEINSKTRNGCRACRYQRCLDRGMSLKNSKIGRQSNLFKQKLMSDKAAPSQAKLEPRQPVLSDLGVEEALEPGLRDFVKTVCSAYAQSFPAPPRLCPDQLPLGFFFADYQQYNQAFVFLDAHTTQAASFLQQSLRSLQTLSAADQLKVLANGVHSLRLLQLANDPACPNYFNTDDRSFQHICRLMPVFAHIGPCLKALSELVRGLKLDAKEFALYSALVAFSSGRGLSTIKDFYGLNLELCQALMAYMKLRRNECESCEFLIHLGFRFEKLSLQLQTGVYEAFKRLETLRGSGPPGSLCISVIYSPFEACPPP